MLLVYKNTSCEEDSFVNFWIFKKFLDLLLAFFFAHTFIFYKCYHGIFKKI